jgi:hypothetical protein
MNARIKVCVDKEVKIPYIGEKPHFIINKLENDKMSTNHVLEQFVATLVQEHFELEEDLEQIVWLKKGPPSEIRLLEVNRNTAATGMVEVFGFAPSADVPYPLRIAEITPDEWERVQNGTISLPESWSLEDAEIFTREHVFA